MIELTQEEAFRRGHLTQWQCVRCWQPVPDKMTFTGPDGERIEYHSSPSARVFEAEIINRRSLHRLITTVLLTFLVGALTVGTTDRLPAIGPLATWFDDMLMYLIRGSISLVPYTFGAVCLGLWIDYCIESFGLYWPRRAE
jgi:hypothetical protein